MLRRQSSLSRKSPLSTNIHLGDQQVKPPNGHFITPGPPATEPAVARLAHVGQAVQGMFKRDELAADEPPGQGCADQGEDQASCPAVVVSSPQSARTLLPSGPPR